MLDFRFRLEKPKKIDDIINDLENSFAEGDLKHIYGLAEVDIGPEVHNCTTHSAVFIKENIKLVGDSLYLPGYFDNENSGNRFYDLVQYITAK